MTTSDEQGKGGGLKREENNEFKNMKFISLLRTHCSLHKYHAL
jgi:hypothetical protein